MKISEIDLEEKAIEAIQGCLSGIPIVNRVNIKKEPGSGRVSPDLLVDLEIVGPKKNWKIQELSNESEVSLGQTSNIKKLLTDRE